MSGLIEDYAGLAELRLIARAARADGWGGRFAGVSLMDGLTRGHKDATRAPGAARNRIFAPDLRRNWSQSGLIQALRRPCANLRLIARTARADGWGGRFGPVSLMDGLYPGS